MGRRYPGYWVYCPPIRPKRPKRPELLQPKDMQRRGRAQTKEGRIALLHAIAHIELNAIDLAADILVRFSNASPAIGVLQ